MLYVKFQIEKHCLVKHFSFLEKWLLSVFKCCGSSNLLFFYEQLIGPHPTFSECIVIGKLCLSGPAYSCPSVRPCEYGEKFVLGLRVTLLAESTLWSSYMRKRLSPLPEAIASACADCLDLTKSTQQCSVCYPLSKIIASICCFLDLCFFFQGCI